MSRAKSNTKNVRETTPAGCLPRHKHSRKYYGRFTLRGKQKWVSLDMDVPTVAKLPVPNGPPKTGQLLMRLYVDQVLPKRILS